MDTRRDKKKKDNLVHVHELCLCMPYFGAQANQKENEREGKLKRAMGINLIIILNKKVFAEGRGHQEKVKITKELILLRFSAS